MKLLDKTQPAKNGNTSEAVLFQGGDTPVWHRYRVFLVSFGFLIVLLVGFIGLIVWSWYGSLEESVPGVGQIVPEGKLRRVMSPINGVVSKVHVKENQKVKAGQILVELDTEPSAVEKQGFEEQLAQLKDEANAMRSATLGGSGSLSASDFGHIQGEWLNAARQTYIAQKNEAKMAISQAEYRQRETIERLKQAQEVLATNEALLKNYQDLYEEGGLSAKDLQEYKQRTDQLRGDVAALKESVESAKYALAQAKQNAAEVEYTFRRDVLGQLADHEQAITRLQTDLKKNEVLIKHQTIVAPINGIVNEQVVRGPGEVVTTGQPLLSLVPVNSKMVAEVRVSNRDLSYIHLNQRAALRLDAFPYQQFGRLYGTVVGISPSSQQGSAAPPPADGSAAQQPQQIFYVLTIRPDKLTMTGEDGKAYRIRSGMTLSADIITREKNILSFFTEPIRIHLDRAFRDPTNR